jgi:DNA-binding transcriptional ArsR family regulator
MKPLSEDQVGLITRRAGALSDPTRVRILEVLDRAPQRVGDIAEALASQHSTVSRHLQVLFTAGLVHRRREASAVIYSIASPELLAWCRALGDTHLKAAGRER